MDELDVLRMLGFSGVDLAAVFSFVAFGIVSFLAPVIGYRSRRPSGITASLFLLAGYIGLSVTQLIVLWAQLPDHTGFRPFTRGEMFRMLLPFALLKLVVFLAAMVSFAIGVSSIQLAANKQDGGRAGVGDQVRT